MRLAVVGLGRGFILSKPALLAHPRVRLAGAFDLRESARLRFAAEFGTPPFESLAALLAAPGIDAVYIATPHELHADQAIAALRHGKHVLVEKPMATSVADCLAMEQAARAANRVLIVGPSHGFDHPVRRAAQLIASGQWGRLRMITAINFTDFMYRPRRPEELDAARGGGVVYSQAAHHIDVARRLAGAPVTALRAVTGTWDPARRSEGAYSALMTFAGGATASLTYSGYAHFDSDELMGWVSELGHDKDADDYGAARRKLAGLAPGAEAQAKTARGYGDTGSAGADTPTARHHEHFGFVIASCEGADIRLAPDGLTVYADDRRSFIAIPPPAVPRDAVIDELVDAVSGTARPIHDARWGLETMACCAALLESARPVPVIVPPRCTVPVLIS